MQTHWLNTEYRLLDGDQLLQLYNTCFFKFIPLRGKIIYCKYLDLLLYAKGVAFVYDVSYRNRT